MDYLAALDYLKGIELIGIKPELETCRAILPHLPLATTLSAIKFIQVAGTNGKGSTAHFLAAILKAHGSLVGLFTSPHLCDIRERILINNVLVSQSLFAQGVTAIEQTARQLLHQQVIQRMPTYFEYTFLTALYCFAHQHVQVVVLEVGMGGRWDATTAITPDVTVITTISRDHTAILGAHPRDIAAEKAGIIKTGVPIVCACPPRSIAQKVIKAVAHQHNAPFFPVIDAHNRLTLQGDSPPYQCIYTTADTPPQYTFSLFLNGAHQARNAATAIKTLRVFAALPHINMSFTHDTFRQGIAECTVPGRIEVFSSLIPPVIIDGAHNVQSITALTQYLQQQQKKSLTLIFGVLADKNYPKMIRLLLPYIRHVILTVPLSPRALPSLDLVKLFAKNSDPKTVFVRDTPEEAFSTARQFNKEILITGSFYLVGVLRDIVIKTISNEKRNIRNPE